MGSPIIKDVVSYRPGLSYTVISHVWSHGLGNPSANALPTSWLKELQGYLSYIGSQERTEVCRWNSRQWSQQVGWPSWPGLAVYGLVVYHLP